MNSKKIFYALSIALATLYSGIGYTMSISDLEAKSLMERVIVTDWSPDVVKQTDNTCAFNAIYNASVLFNSTQLDPQTRCDNFTTLPLQQWQKFIGKTINLSGSELREVALHQADLPRERITIIDSITDFMDRYKHGPMLADDEHIHLYHAMHTFRAHTPNHLPHIFFLGTMKDSQGSNGQSTANQIGHWVTCVAHKNSAGQLQLDYADSMDPASPQTLDETEQKKLMDELGLDTQNLATVLNENSQIVTESMQNRRLEITRAIEKLLLDKNPIQLLMTSPLGDRLDSVRETLAADNPSNAFPHLKKAVDYVLEWNLLDNENFKQTEYPANILKAINRTFNAHIPDNLAENAMIAISNFEDDTSLEEAIVLLQEKPILQAYMPTDSPIIEDSSDNQQSDLPMVIRGPAAALEEPQQIQKNWFQRVASYITPQRLLLSGFCAAGLWVLNNFWNKRIS